MGFRAIGFKAKVLTILVEGGLSVGSGRADPYIDPHSSPLNQPARQEYLYRRLPLPHEGLAVF